MSSSMSSFSDSENMTSSASEKCGKQRKISKATYDAEKRKISATKSATDDKAEYQYEQVPSNHPKEHSL